MSSSCHLNPAYAFRVINVLADGHTNDAGQVPRIHMIKELMMCKAKQVTKQYVDANIHLKQAYSVIIEENDGKFYDITFWI